MNQALYVQLNSQLRTTTEYGKPLGDTRHQAYSLLPLTTNGLLLIFLRQLLKQRQGLFDGIVVNAVAGPEIPRAAKVRARYQQQIILLGPFTESIVVFFQTFGEQIEGTLWL